jgi:hypothetical protein
VSVVKAMWRILSLPCRDAAEVASQTLDGTVPRHLRLAAFLHRLICSGCRRYRRQLLAMRAALQRLAREPEDGAITQAATMPAPARERIRQALRDADGATS